MSYIKYTKHEDDDEYEYEEERCIASYSYSCSSSSSSSMTAFLRYSIVSSSLGHSWIYGMVDNWNIGQFSECLLTPGPINIMFYQILFETKEHIYALLIPPNPNKPEHNR